MKNIQDIIPDRTIIRMKNEELFGIEYETWNISLPVFCDQIERLLENGFLVSMLEDSKITVSRKLATSPDNLHKNKVFWNNLQSILNGEKE